MTLVKTSDKEISDYFRIRHIIAERTGRTNGMVITVLGLHRFYGSDPSIRTNFDFLLFKSAPTNKYDRKFTEEYIGKEGIKTLSDIELQRNREPELFELTLGWIKGNTSGLLMTPAPPIDPMIDVTNVRPQPTNKRSLRRLLLWRANKIKNIDDPIDGIEWDPYEHRK